MAEVTVERSLVPSGRLSADHRLRPTMAAQFGLCSRTQALAAGHNARSTRHRLASGRWQRVLPNVYRLAGTPRTWHQHAMAAALWAAEKGVISHGAAARLWRLDGFESAEVEVSIVGSHRDHNLPFVVHRVSDHVMTDISLVQNISVTSVRRTILDIAGTRHPRTEAALDEVLRRHFVSLGDLWLLYEQEWTRGRRGIAILRALLIERTKGLAPTDSQLEVMLWRIIKDFGLRRPTRQFPVELSTGKKRLDFCYPEAMLVIEADSYAYHSDREAFENDRRRDNELRAMGWTVLRFTYSDLRWRPEYVAEMIRAHLEAPSRRVGG